jgi:hypothetical protein
MRRRAGPGFGPGFLVHLQIVLILIRQWDFCRFFTSSLQLLDNLNRQLCHLIIGMKKRRLKMKNKVLVLAVVFTLLTCSGLLVANERRGADLVITKTDGQEIKGELIAVKPSSLLLLDSQTGGDVSAEIGEIEAIKIVKKSKALVIGACGLGLGVVMGILAGESGQSEEMDSWGAFFNPMIFNPVFIATGLGIVLGISGALIGASVGKDKTIQLQGNSPEEIRTIMDKLRAQARVTDFQ